MIDLDMRRKAGLLTIAATAVSAAAMVAAPVLTAPVATAQGCPDIEVVFARGTDEPPGLGRVGGAFVDSLRDRVGGRSLGTYAVNYPASFDFLQVAAGANDASDHIQYMIANCPNTRLVLGGYSQGAAVVDVIAAVPVPGAGFTAPLPPQRPRSRGGDRGVRQPVGEDRAAADLEPGLGRPVHRPVHSQRSGVFGRRRHPRPQQLRAVRADRSGRRIRRGTFVDELYVTVHCAI